MSTLKQVEEQLRRYPHLEFGDLPTPLEPLEMLSQQLKGPQLWVKRDDEYGPGMGGNKGRKLAYLMAKALAEGKNKIVTFGGLQSNHARMTAAACASLGLEAHLFFFQKRPDRLDGNLLLDRLFGARMHFLPFGGGSSGSMSIEMTNRLVKLVANAWTGFGTYFIPVGGHNVTGALGYLQAALEIQKQVNDLGLDAERVTVVTACGTGGTLAGLMAGFALIESPVKVLGIDIGKLWKGFPASIARLATKLCQVFEGQIQFRPDQVPLKEGTYAGDGYARYDPGTGRAIRLLARSEGIILDPVYTGKAFAGLLDLIDKRQFGLDDVVIFLHSGGAPGLWAFTEALANDVPDMGQL